MSFVRICIEYTSDGSFLNWNHAQNAQKDYGDRVKIIYGPTSFEVIFLNPFSSPKSFYSKIHNQILADSFLNQHFYSNQASESEFYIYQPKKSDIYVIAWDSDLFMSSDSQEFKSNNFEDTIQLGLIKRNTKNSNHILFISKKSNFSNFIKNKMKMIDFKQIANSKL